MEGKEEKYKVNKESREKIIEKRGKRKQERVTRTDQIVVDRLKKERERVDDLSQVRKLPEPKDEETELNPEEKPTEKKTGERGSYTKLLEVLKKSEERNSYERWESIKVLRECMKDEEGYLVKANQKGRRDWSKERVKAFESDLRNYESEVPNYEVKKEEEDGEKTEETIDRILRERLSEEAKTRDPIEEKGEKREEETWGFWKYYLEKDAQKVVVWKKGVLYKKGRRKNEITSWDRGTYRKEWYDQRRTMKLRRRYVREGGYVLQKPKGEGTMVKEVELKPMSLHPIQGDGSGLVANEKGTSRRSPNESKKERRKRTYYKYQNPEDRKKERNRGKRTEETDFQSILRKQIAVDRKRGKLMKKSLVIYPNKDGWKRKAWKASIQKKMGLARVEGKRSSKLRVWSSQVGRLRYNQRRWKINRKRNQK